MRYLILMAFMIAGCTPPECNPPNPNDDTLCPGESMTITLDPCPDGEILVCLNEDCACQEVRSDVLDDAETIGI